LDVVEVTAVRWPLVVLATAAALAGCSAAKDVPLTQQAIALFHRQLDAGQFDRIYDASTQDIKGATSKASLGELLAALHVKLGAFRSGSTTNWNDYYGTSGHVVTIVYAATFEHGPAQETFVYRIDDDHAVLAGYHYTVPISVFTGSKTQH
jgi:hypothetical protein